MAVVRISGRVSNVPKGYSSTTVGGKYTLQAKDTVQIESSSTVNIFSRERSVIGVRIKSNSGSAQLTNSVDIGGSFLPLNSTRDINVGYYISTLTSHALASAIAEGTQVTYIAVNGVGISGGTITPLTTGTYIEFFQSLDDISKDRFLDVYTTTSTFHGGKSTVDVEGQIVVGPHIDRTNSTEEVKTLLINKDPLENVDNPFDHPYDENDIYDTPEHRKIASLYVPGGVGIEKDLNVGGYIYGRIAKATSSTLLIVTNTNEDKVFYPLFAEDISGISASQLYGNSSTYVDPVIGLTYNPSSGILTFEQGYIASTLNSTGTGNGALVVEGGVSIKRDIGVGGDVLPRSITTASNIGNSDLHFYKGYVDNLYSSLIQSVNTATDYEKNINMYPQPGHHVDIYGDIRVRGDRPIGTAPVVTNVLWVTMDGDDTNDGRAEDPSRACRTVTGAVNSPYYQPGTQIRVRAGHYLEDNPIRLKPYTSVMGSDLRTTSIEPINKTQDLFHVDSGCYLAFMQFTNGRSGLLEGPYLPEHNRGAYCTAFPPLTGNDRIDLFHSPYIQNCTNQTGPWLKDGVMFLPSATVQVPKFVGTATWEIGTSTIDVYSTGTVKPEVGMYVNSGYQTPGFFNARSLLLANKPFLQEQVVEFVDQTFSSGFSYSTSTCSRDIALIIDGLATDLIYRSNSESIFSGLQYWNQGTYTGEIPAEISYTIAAINHVKGLAAAAVSNYASFVNQEFTVITNILTSGVAGITDTIVSNGPPSTNLARINDYNALIAAIPSIQDNTIDYITDTLGFTNYLEDTCRRDIAYIIKSVAFDLLNPNETSPSSTNRQAIKSGVYYYSYNSASTAIPNEVPQTTAAYGFIKGIIGNIVTSTPLPSTYQSEVTQYISTTSYATIHEANFLKDGIDTITKIIRNGPSVVENKIPITGVATTSSVVVNAYELLKANKAFIQAETIAYIDTALSNFNYSREKCFRDVGIIVENVSYDAVFGGNEKSVRSGLAYYDGVISRITGQETQTVSAIDYLNQMCQKVVQNIPITSLAASPTYEQIINYSLSGGEIIIPTMKENFEIITNIIENGPDVAPSIILGQGPDAAFMSAEILMQANRKFIQQQTINYINWTVKQFPYSQLKCSRDIGIIVDSIISDTRYEYVTNTENAYVASTFAGIQYWNQAGYTGKIYDEIDQTIDAFTYLKDLSAKIIKNITPADDLIPRYYTGTEVTQVVYLPSQSDYIVGSDSEVKILNAEYDIILSILNGNTSGWTDLIIPNGEYGDQKLISRKNSYRLLIENIPYMQEEIIAYIDLTNPGFSTQYDKVKCRRDIGYMVRSVGFDMLCGGNRQAITAGLSYYTYENGTSNISTEKTQTIAAFTHLKELMISVVSNEYVEPLQTTVEQKLSEDITYALVVPFVTNAINNGIITINALITNPVDTVSLNLSPPADPAENQALADACKMLLDNKDFLIAETIAFIEQTYNYNSFQYNEALCYRDTGYIIDAVSQDILMGGNSKSIEAGVSYWNQGYNYVSGQITTTTMAINYARDISLLIAGNQPVPVITGTTVSQVINTYFEYGGDYMPQQAITRNYGIITRIIENGPIYAPPLFQGSGLYSATGQLADEVRDPPRVTDVRESTTTSGLYTIALSTTTIGYARNATLFLGDVTVFPLSDKEVEALSDEYTGDPTTWNSRKVDPIGAMGGSLVDGAVISDKSPIQSFVYDAFTQVNQGGVGIHITRNGYAQLVSVFTIFSAVGVQVDSGGIASIVNSNANFGDICLLAKGFGKRAFSGTVYNPPYKAYPDSPGVDGINQYYPNGFWPNQGNIMIFVPDLKDRPHISLVMEIEPEDGHVNEQAFPGFLNAQPSMATLTTGTITITDIDNTGVAIGNYLYVRNEAGQQLGSDYEFSGTPGVRYVETGTVVTDVGYRSITLNKALTNGGGDPNNANYFTLYFCGNAYYTVLSSTVATNPRVDGTNILSIANTTTDQVQAHIEALQYLNSLTNSVIGNALIPTTMTYQTTVTQTVLPLVTGGSNATDFINLRFGDMTTIIGADTIDTANALYPQNLWTKTGTPPVGAGSAVTLIEANVDFLAAEVTEYVKQTFTSTMSFSYDPGLCVRDTGLIVDALVQDLLFDGNSQSTFAGIQYWTQTSGYVGLVDSEITTTTAAISHVKQLAIEIIQGLTGPSTRYQSDVLQITNDPGTSAEALIVANDFDVILGILGASTLDGITDSIIPNGITPSTDGNVVQAFNILQLNKKYIQAEVIAYINEENPGFNYNQAKCYRDVGYMIDSVSVDLLYPNPTLGAANRQAIQSGVYYWDYDSNSTRLPGENEIAQTIRAYERIREIIPDLVRNIPITPSPNNNVSQVTYITTSTKAQATVLQNLITDNILNIIANGPEKIKKTAISPDISTNPDTIHAAEILYANKEFIQTEVIAYINNLNTITFDFDQSKCKRDVKLILQRLIYDIASGGRYNSVMNGFSYWSRNGTHHIVSLGENVRRNDLFPDGCTVNFYQRSYISASGYVFEYVGAGTNYGALPQVGYADPVQSKETVQLANGKVFFTSTDQNGDFRIGPGLVISQATGVLSGRTFSKSLFANMTPFILAVEGG